MTEVKQQQPYVRNVLRLHGERLNAAEVTLADVDGRSTTTMEVVSDSVSDVTNHKGLLQDLLHEVATHESKLVDHERLLGGTSMNTQAQAAMLNLLLTMGFWAKVRWFLFNRLPESPIPSDKAVLYPRAR